MSINILVVVRWPLGGIRTYMKYVYAYLPETFNLTILAASTHEDGALRSDADALGARLILVPANAKGGLAREIVRELRQHRYDLIQSHGFISALQAYAANIMFRIPHVLTVHGILEERYLEGIFGRLKKLILAWVIKHISVLYAVSNDILKHLQDQIPSIDNAACQQVVIANGIEVESLNQDDIAERNTIRKSLGLGNEIFLIGFLGRFMPQKGLNFLIEAVEILEKGSEGNTKKLHVLAVGSGDYLPFYQKMASEKKVDHLFTFIPFQKDVIAIFNDVDMVAMPSIWEASGLLAMEAMCSGTPLIASDCIGLRETVAGTPATVFPSGDAAALAEAIQLVRDSDMKPLFVDFAPQACERYDVRKTAQAVQMLFEGVVTRQQPRFSEGADGR